MNYDNLKRPLVLVIFGITGDLSQRYVLPALYRLCKKHELPEQLHIVGISRRDVTRGQVYTELRRFVGSDDYDGSVEQRLKDSTEMVQMDLDSAEAYHELLEHLRDIEAKYETGASRLYHLSVPSQAFAPIVKLLGQTGHSAPLSNGDTPRLLVEKPFGYDLQSAKALVAALDEHFDENQVYRIDHYVAKEASQNLLAFRFQNPLFEGVWSRERISRIKITIREQIDIEGRATFYEQTGALRDMVQNHLLQLMAITMMPRPARLESDVVHSAKLSLLKAVQPITASKVSQKAIRAQYEGYRDEVGNAESVVETYARIELSVDNDQWRDVPVTLETGKALDGRRTEIIVCFRQRDDTTEVQNRLVFRIQPDEGITLRLQAKRPGIRTVVVPADMEFTYARAFSEPSTDAYERVIVDAIRGDQTLFSSAAEVLRSWEIIEQVLQRWQRDGEGLLFYPKGSEGPVSPVENAK